MAVNSQPPSFFDVPTSYVGDICIGGISRSRSRTRCSTQRSEEVSVLEEKGRQRGTGDFSSKVSWEVREISLRRRGERSYTIEEESMQEEERRRICNMYNFPN